MPRLSNGDAFPDLTIDTVGDGASVRSRTIWPAVTA